MMLELFVAFLQAFIFSLLASVFIGQIREGGALDCRTADRQRRQPRDVS